MSGPAPRKACDLCYRRKIKCDGQLPRCSTCVLHESECTFTAASRKTPSRKQRTIELQQREADLQLRVEYLEGELGRLLNRFDKLEQKQGLSPLLPAFPPGDMVEDVAAAPVPSQLASSLPSLPPLHAVLPVVEQYLSNLNSVLPLFDAPTLLHTVRTWYADPHSRTRTTWAIINVVLALAHHTCSPAALTPIGSTSTFLANAQSVTAEIVMGEPCLAGVQVLLGMVMLFWTAEDLQPALILVGTALRLAQRLGLHHDNRSGLHCASAARQRSRVFWMAYILDRDISLNSRIQDIQLDDDIEAELPPWEPAPSDEDESGHNEDMAGFVVAADGVTKFSYFRARVELARIQGKVYSSVYAAPARRLTPTQRSSAASAVLADLDAWALRVPPAFHASALARPCLEACAPLARHFCLLYSVPLSCRALLIFASARDSFPYSEWIGFLMEYGGRVAAGREDGSGAPIPHGWCALLRACREYMGLFATATSIDPFFVRMTLCAHNSSLISLTANRLFDCCGLQPEVQLDRQISRTAMKNLQSVASQSESDVDTQRVRDGLQQLYLYVSLITPPGQLNAAVGEPE